MFANAVLTGPVDVDFDCSPTTSNIRCLTCVFCVVVVVPLRSSRLLLFALFLCVRVFFGVCARVCAVLYFARGENLPFPFSFAWRPFFRCRRPVLPAKLGAAGSSLLHRTVNRLFGDVRSATVAFSVAQAMPPSKNISFDELSRYFHLPINQVAKELGVCATILKKICRRNGIPRWPHRKVGAVCSLASCLA